MAASYTTPSGFSASGLGPWTIRAILKRRLRDAGLPTILASHSFRVLVVIDLLKQGVPHRGRAVPRPR